MIDCSFAVELAGAVTAAYNKSITILISVADKTLNKPDTIAHRIKPHMYTLYGLRKCHTKGRIVLGRGAGCLMSSAVFMTDSFYCLKTARVYAS